MRIATKAALLSKIGIGALAVVMLTGGLCRKTVGTTITVVNGTDAAVNNVEVTYAGGNIGAAHIEPKGQFSKWVPAKGECHVKLTFQEAAKKQAQPTAVDTTEPCPASVKFFIERDSTVRSELK